ncbi:MAG: TetR/AcrR family transcriptional regulator [Sphingomonadaceae bacterium]|nr:TetR/AcrR family transcriptional regulator [Sphingomonadaceae bacterium]
MGRPLRVTDEQIIEAARHCFAEHGFGVSVNVIADHVKVTSPLIFKRFHSKANLMKLAMLGVTPMTDFPWAALSRPLTAATAREQLEAFVAELLEHFASAAPMLGALLKSGLNPPEVHNALVEIGESARAFSETRNWLADAQNRKVLGRCDVAALTSMIFGSAMFAATSNGEQSPDHDGACSYATQLLSIIWPGIEGGSNETHH